MNELESYQIGMVTGFVIGVLMVFGKMYISTQLFDFPLDEQPFTVVFMMLVGVIISLVHIKAN